MKNVVIHLTLFWFKLQIKTQGKYHLPFLPASQPSVRCCKIILIEGLSKFMSFLQKNRTIDWNAVTSKASFNFSYVPVFTLSFQWWILKSFKYFFFVILPSSKSTTRNTELVCNTFIRPTLFKFFNVSYFTFEVTSWCFLFVAIFVASATNNRIQTNLKILKHSTIM